MEYLKLKDIKKDLNNMISINKKLVELKELINKRESIFFISLVGIFATCSILPLSYYAITKENFDNLQVFILLTLGNLFLGLFSCMLVFVLDFVISKIFGFFYRKKFKKLFSISKYILPSSIFLNKTKANETEKLIDSLSDYSKKYYSSFATSNREINKEIFFYEIILNTLKSEKQINIETFKKYQEIGKNEFKGEFIASYQFNLLLIVIKELSKEDFNEHKNYLIDMILNNLKGEHKKRASEEVQNKIDSYSIKEKEDKDINDNLKKMKKVEVFKEMTLEIKDKNLIIKSI